MNILRKIQSAFLPIWSKGLECEICQKTFLDEKFHYDHVMKNRTESSHKYKVPVLRRE